MAKLSIEYDALRRRAILSMEDQGLQWSQIRRACEDHSPDFEDLGPDRITLPWWGFLSARAAINFYVARYQVDVEFDATSRSLLEDSRRRASSYRDSVDSPPVSEGLLLEELKARGFERPLTIHQIRNVK